MQCRKVTSLHYSATDLTHFHISLLISIIMGLVIIQLLINTKSPPELIETYHETSKYLSEIYMEFPLQNTNQTLFLTHQAFCRSFNKLTLIPLLILRMRPVGVSSEMAFSLD